jgi:hypothetical protein
MILPATQSQRSVVLVCFCFGCFCQLPNAGWYQAYARSLSLRCSYSKLKLKLKDIALSVLWVIAKHKIAHYTSTPHARDARRSNTRMLDAASASHITPRTAAIQHKHKHKGRKGGVACCSLCVSCCVLLLVAYIAIRNHNQNQNQATSSIRHLGLASCPCLVIPRRWTGAPECHVSMCDQTPTPPDVS